MSFARYPRYHPPQTSWVICTDCFRLEKVKRSWLDLGSNETDKTIKVTYPRQDYLELHIEDPFNITLMRQLRIIITIRLKLLNGRPAHAGKATKATTVSL